VRLVYHELIPQSEGGRILVDDYGIWEGCTLATHEYLLNTSEKNIHRCPAV
jgi:hypothetical protein